MTKSESTISDQPHSPRGWSVKDLAQQLAQLGIGTHTAIQSALMIMKCAVTSKPFETNDVTVVAYKDAVRIILFSELKRAASKQWAYVNVESMQSGDPTWKAVGFLVRSHSGNVPIPGIQRSKAGAKRNTGPLKVDHHVRIAFMH